MGWCCLCITQNCRYNRPQASLLRLSSHSNSSFYRIILVTEHLYNIFLYVPLRHRFSRPLLYQLPLSYGTFTEGAASFGRNYPLSHELSRHSLRMCLLLEDFQELDMAGSHGLHLRRDINGWILLSPRKSQVFN
jgi:hypothetical protein